MYGINQQLKCLIYVVCFLCRSFYEKVTSRVGISLSFFSWHLSCFCVCIYNVGLVAHQNNFNFCGRFAFNFFRYRIKSRKGIPFSDIINQQRSISTSVVNMTKWSVFFLASSVPKLSFYFTSTIEFYLFGQKFYTDCT